MILVDPISIEEAQARIEELLDRAAAGEDVCIETESGQLVRLVVIDETD